MCDPIVTSSGESFRSCSTDMTLSCRVSSPPRCSQPRFPPSDSVTTNNVEGNTAFLEFRQSVVDDILKSVIKRDGRVALPLRRASNDVRPHGLRVTKQNVHLGCELRTLRIVHGMVCQKLTHFFQLFPSEQPVRLILNPIRNIPTNKLIARLTTIRFGIS